MAFEVGGAFAKFLLPRKKTKLREIERAMVVATHLGIVEVLQMAGEMNF